MLPKRVQKNQPITADLLNNIIDSIRECQIQPGTGYSFSRTAGGTVLSIAQAQKAKAPAAGTICPFTPTAEAVTGGFDVSFSIGTVNGILPTNIFDKIEGVTTSARTYFYVNCDTDGKLVTECRIEDDTQIRTPQEVTPDAAPDVLDILIATMSTAGVISKTIPCSNISIRILTNIQEDNVAYVAGERNFTQYYNWDV